ncbi:diphthine--ammonia ligase [Hyperolius riggenbachi]|uniref:diphthine--ammonia ligase n=1 Tax=Hyperolius riggenbachi TaxID=752182 RepID=UPI0035A32662
MRVVALISGGKDSCYNMMQCVMAGHQIVALGNLKPPDSSVDELDSYMYQTVGYHALDLYAEAMGLPLYRATLSGTSLNTGRGYTPQEGDEVEDLHSLLKMIKEKENVEAVSVGAILSDYQRVRVENVCQRLSLQPLAYLWRRSQEDLLDEMINSGLQAILIKVAAFGLDPDKHLGKTLEEMRPYLRQLSSKYGVHVCGEGGEYETLTLDCPLFSKKIVVDSTEVMMHSNDAFAPVAYLRLLRLHLEDKTCSPVLKSGEPCPCHTEQLVSEESEPHKETEDEPLAIIPQAWPSGNAVYWSPQTHSGFQWISEVAAAGNNVAEATRAALSSLKAQAEDTGLQMTDAVLVHLYVQTMDDFAAINAEYGKLFSTSPPARVCVQCCLPQATLFKMDVLFWLPVACRDEHTPEKIAMHVQSISHWAPANIGPYSQAVRVGGAIFCAGQIALKPCTMQLVPGGIVAESRLSLRHVERVLDAMGPDASLTHVLVAQCYVTRSSYIRNVMEAWKEWFKHQHAAPVLTVVVVPRLPRGAAVEWHVFAALSDPADQRHFSESIRRSGYEAVLSGSISSCQRCASFVLSVSASSPQEVHIDMSHASCLMRELLHKASPELSPHNLIPVSCRTFHRSNSAELQTLQAELLVILKEVWEENAPCPILVPVVDLPGSELISLSVWLSS